MYFWFVDNYEKWFNNDVTVHYATNSVLDAQNYFEKNYWGSNLVVTSDPNNKSTVMLATASYQDFLDFKDEHDLYWDQQVEQSRSDDVVERPAHYQDVIPGWQYMELMQYMLADVDSHLMGQIYKYTMRCGKKDEDAQELGKIIWYAKFLRARKIVKRNIKVAEIEDILSGKVSS